MAVILNTVPIEQKQNTALQSVKRKDGSKSGKSEMGFAKTLNSETDKSEMDVDSKLKSNDTLQLMVAMMGMPVPVVVNLTTVAQVVGNTSDTVVGAISTTQTKLATGPGVAQQVGLPQSAQMANAVPGIPQPAQIATTVSGLPQSIQLPVASGLPQPTVLANAASGLPQPTQLANAASGLSQPTQLANAASGLSQPIQLANATSGLSQPDQLANAVPGIPQPDQLASAVPGGIPQTEQLTNAVPGISQQAQLGNVVFGSQQQAQLANNIPPQVKLPNTAFKDSELDTLLPNKTIANTQVNNTKLGELAQLQGQAQLQSKPIPGQVEVTTVTNNDTDMLMEKSTLLSIAPTLATMSNTSIIGRNSDKLLDGKKIVAGQNNVEAIKSVNNFGMVEPIDVKPVLVPQVARAVADSLLSGSKDNIDTILPNQTVQSPDIFASMLNQQGLKIETRTGVEINQGPAQQVADPYNVTGQIVDQARLVTGTKNTEMIIQLKPEHLGELTFKVSVENGVVSASFHSNNPEVRSIIESSLYQLKQEMSNQGLKIDNVGVYAGLGQSFSNDQQSGNYQQPVIKLQNNKTEEDFRDVFEATDSTNRIVNSTGVDYHV